MDAQTLSLLGTLVAFALGGLWKLTRVETALREDIHKSRDEIEEKQERYTHDIGETVAAIRQRIADVELYGANNYVRRDGFAMVQNQLTADINKLGDRIETRLSKLETKIDTKT